MNESKFQMIWKSSYHTFCDSGTYQSDVQRKASFSILNCKSGKLGVNISQCPDCGYLAFHNNSCHNRNCPNCQAVNFMWFLPFLMNSIRYFIVISNFFILFFTDAVPSHF